MIDQPIRPFPDEYFMRQALQEALLAYDAEEVPIGAVIVVNDMIIGRGHNLTESLQDVTAHAEMMAITAAQNQLGSKILSDCTLYVTVEPCIMCAGAIRHARVSRVVWGASEPKMGFTQFADNILHRVTAVTSGVLSEECAQLMREFFVYRR
ncbi:MAG: nucleoside deaminase [Bacteroidales bacterium]|uniref:nucleoside deaminase n=1 Tax=Porphyromonas sp. TaxID=1924944 RepID=UPI002976EC2F|nr:nucleoside deaminase [Porphyromonas sp.]MDD7437861.1 nucleoside deaminase [Bacteroidales bacterium]MDY3067746.1 nucleoside deaminase [Porphyromonas sp.]